MKHREISLNEMRNRLAAAQAAETTSYAALLAAAAKAPTLRNLAAAQAAAIEWIARNRRAKAVAHCAQAQWARNYY